MSQTNGHQQLAPLEVAVLAKAETDVELSAIELDPGAGSSHQAVDHDEMWTPSDAIPPPEDLGALQAITEYSQIRDTCIGALVRNTVGLGWSVEAWPDHHDEATPEMIAECRGRLDACARRDYRMNGPSFSDLMESVKRDQKEIGNGYIEVSRNKRTGMVDGLFYVPGVKVRRKRDRSGYVMGENPETAGDEPLRVDFLNFGQKVQYDSKGRPLPKLAKSVSRWHVNELVPLREYTARSRDYGLPRDLGLAAEYLAARFVEEWTHSFFAASGVPPRLVFVAGQEVKDGSSQRVKFTVPKATINRIDQAIRSDAKPGARVAVIPVPPGTTISDVELGELSDKDLTFGEFKGMHREHVGSAFDLMPIFYGDINDSGRYTAEVQRAFTLEQTFDPDQRQTEDRLWNSLLTDMGYAPLRLKFKRMAVEGDAVRRESAQAAAEVGVITVRQFLDAHGLPPLDESIHGKGINDELVVVGQPPGAENREPISANDQRGLQPGIGGRVAKSGSIWRRHEHLHGVEHVEDEVEDLAKQLAELPVE